tara:strand:- start:23 stop:304 length:282 start_codon:yes stop_codon:yes gene_type:complete
MKATIDRLQHKLEKLVAKHEDVKGANVRLTDQMTQLRQQLDTQQESVQELEDKNKILKLSASLHGEEQDTQAARKKINELVREIDKCIALLNK